MLLILFTRNKILGMVNFFFLFLFSDTGNASDVQQENETVCPSLERSTGSSPTNEVSKFTGDEVSSRDKEGTKMKSGFCSLL